jgi:hypothetical protein
MCASSAPEVDGSLPEWMDDAPEWARDPRYANLDAVTALEIRRGFIGQAAVDHRLHNRKSYAKWKAKRRPRPPADRMLAKLKAHCSMWRNHIARAEAAKPGSPDAMQALFSLPSYRVHLADAEAKLSAYVESALRAELARDG